FAATKLTMPVLVLGGEKSGGDFLIAQGKLVATHVEGVLVTGSGHWLVDEAPGQVIPRLVEFFNRPAGSARTRSSDGMPVIRARAGDRWRLRRYPLLLRLDAGPAHDLAPLASLVADERVEG